VHAVDDLLVTMKIEDSRYVRMTARAPWGIAFPARDLTRLILVSRGSCWLTGAGLDRPQWLGSDDCFLVRAGVTFELADAPGRDLVDCDGVTETSGSTATVGGDGELTEIVSSRFAFDAIAAEALFALLPPLYPINLDADSSRQLRATFDLIAQETAARALGSGFVTSRLSDVLFVQALRACCTDVGTGSVGWLAALRDPQLAPAINQLHTDIAHPWTVGELARVAGMSRAAFAASFKEKTGDTPLGYLTTWRIYRAKILLRDTNLSVREIATKVGYRTSQTLSRAFLHRENLPPGAWRASKPPRLAQPGT
jgi:AraC-like DNA-binding protein